MLKGNKVPLGWAQSFETNNLTMFLEKDAVFPCPTILVCNYKLT